MATDAIARRRDLGPASMRVGAVAGAVGVATLLGMYAGFAVGATGPALTLGSINDVTALVTYPAVLPGVLAIHRALRPRHPGLAAAGTAVALGSVGVVVVAQAALVLGAVPFERQWPWAAAGFLAFGGWLVVSGRVGGADGSLPYGPRLGLAALALVGFPTWALRVARWMEDERP